MIGHKQFYAVLECLCSICHCAPPPPPPNLYLSCSVLGHRLALISVAPPTYEYFFAYFSGGEGTCMQACVICPRFRFRTSSAVLNLSSPQARLANRQPSSKARNNPLGGMFGALSGIALLATRRMAGSWRINGLCHREGVKKPP